jgi:hypothetical protein
MIQLMSKSSVDPGFINRLPLGLAAPLREAARTCQLSPPSEWPLAAYRAIGRNDLATCATDAPDMLFNDGYRTVKDYIVRCRRAIKSVVFFFSFNTYRIHRGLVVLPVTSSLKLDLPALGRLTI